jgi:hypothetical protein
LVNPLVVELWTAAEWNNRLVTVILGGSGPPVTYFDAHPTGLTELLDWPSTDETRAQAAALLVDAHRAHVIAAAGSAVAAALQLCRDRMWSVTDTRAPPYFSLLWVTCLVAWGYPDDAEGDFASRWRALFSTDGGGVQPATSENDVATGRSLLGRRVDKVEIRDLWELLARWFAANPDHRELELPEPPPASERHVGTSYALSQPDLHARRWLAHAVTALDVAGYDPPPGPVLRGLVARADQPETATRDYFLCQLRRLEELHRAGGRLHEDPVWAAIRRECISPVTTAGGVVPLTSFTAVLEEYIDSTEAHLVWRGDSEPIRATDGATWRWNPRMDEYELEGACDNGQLWPFLEDPWAHTRTGLARLVREGLVCFARDERARFGVVTGAEVVNAEISLVHDDLLPRLREWAGGSTERIPARRWSLVRGAQLRSVEEELLPEGLEAVRQLVKTSAPPTARWVGGVRAGPRAFYRHHQLLPAVSAPEATTVVDETTRASLLQEDGRWSFDPENPPTGLHVRIVWPEAAGWADTVLEARFEQGAVQPPKLFRSEDHELIGPEFPLACTGEHGLEARSGQIVRLGEASATARRAGPVVGSVDARPADAIMTHHGHPDRMLISVLHQRAADITGRTSYGSAQRRWRFDAEAMGRGRNIAIHHGSVLDENDHVLRHLRRIAARRDLPIVDIDEPDTAVRLAQLKCAWEPLKRHPTAEELLAVTCIDLGRRSVSVKDHLDTITQLTTARQRPSTSGLFSLLRANAEAGRFELARHRARPAVQLVGVRPRMRWALIEPLPAPKRGVFEGALVGLVESSTALRIQAGLAGLAETRWLTATALPAESCPTDRLVAPVLKFLTDEPTRADEIARRHLGGRLGVAGALPTVPDVAPFEPPADVVRRPGGYEITDSYVFARPGPQHIRGRSDSDGVVVERLVAASRSDVYTVVADRAVVYTTLDRDWAAVRAAELAGLPLFGRCRHGVIRSRSALFPRLPMPIGRALLAHGFGLVSSAFDETGRLVSVTYPFGAGAPALDRLPNAWTDPEDCTCMTH